jgi:polyisoprenoid-binding protein YceI
MLNHRRAIALTLPAIIAAIALECAPGDTDAATTVRAQNAAATIAPTSEPVPATAENTTLAPSNAAPIHLVVAPAGNEVRYRVHEQLVRMDLPQDAIGRTGEITGGIGVDNTGQIIPAESKFVINVGTLKSDRDRRDGYIRGRTLETDKYPTVEFAPTGLRGLPKVLPTSGKHTFDVIGNLTVRGVTKPTTWHVTAEAKGGQVTGSAATAFTFSDFSMDQPRVPVLLSVADTIRLEYDFTLIPKG